MVNQSFFQIAIDGPVAAGKGTVSKLASSRLGFLYVDTGAMYRVVSLVVARAHANPAEEDAVVPLLTQAHIELRTPLDHEKDGRLSTVLLNGEDVSWQIRTAEIDAIVPHVAVHPRVREFLVGQQQRIAQGCDVVMEGRDITYRVLPDAQLKIYLTASEEVRAHRRLLQRQEKGEDVTFEQVYADLRERDALDQERSVDPLRIVEGAWVLDTSALAIEEVVERVVKKAEELRLR